MNENVKDMFDWTVPYSIRRYWCVNACPHIYIHIHIQFHKCKCIHHKKGTRHSFALNKQLHTAHGSLNIQHYTHTHTHNHTNNWVWRSQSLSDLLHYSKSKNSRETLFSTLLWISDTLLTEGIRIWEIWTSCHWHTHTHKDHINEHHPGWQAVLKL